MDPLIRRFWIASLIGWVLAAVVMMLAESGPAQPLDEAIITGVRGGDGAVPAWVAYGARGATWFGDTWPRVAFTAAFIGWLLLRRYPRAASYILYVAVGVAVLNAWVLKTFIMRMRPELVPWLTNPNESFSLPSGHAANSAALYGAMALVAGTIFWRRRKAIRAAAALLVLAVGVSRVVLGVHWPSDVVAGWLVGASWALLLAALLKPVTARVAADRAPAAK